MGLVPSQFADRQSPLCALRLDPAKAVSNSSCYIGFMAGAHPLIAVVITVSPTRRQKCQEKGRMIAGVADPPNFALNLTPFQFHGLWLDVMTTPPADPVLFTANEIAGVGE